MANKISRCNICDGYFNSERAKTSQGQESQNNEFKDSSINIQSLIKFFESAGDSQEMIRLSKKNTVAQ
jgi:hypothetical protein